MSKPHHPSYDLGIHLLPLLRSQPRLFKISTFPPPKKVLDAKSFTLVVAFVRCKFRHSEDSSLSVSTKTFHCRRAVRQRDHLSPLLFILATVFLQNIINKATTLGLLITFANSFIWLCRLPHPTKCFMIP